MAFDAIEPLGYRRGDLQTGIIAATIANVNRSADTPPYKASDFMPDFDKPPPEPQTTHEMLNIVEILNAAYGGTDERQ